MRFTGIPVWHLGPIPVNWYGLGWAAAFIVGAALVSRDQDFGRDLSTIEAIGKQFEMAAKQVSGTRSVYAERVSGGYFLDFIIRREAIARYGLTVMDVGRIIESAIGGENIATTI